MIKVYTHSSETVKSVVLKKLITSLPDGVLMIEVPFYLSSSLIDKLVTA